MMQENVPIFMYYVSIKKYRGAGSYEDMSSLSFEKWRFFSSFQEKKKFENPTKFDQVRAKMCLSSLYFTVVKKSDTCKIFTKMNELFVILETQF